jgi:hypothetical protein
MAQGNQAIDLAFYNRLHLDEVTDRLLPALNDPFASTNVGGPHGDSQNGVEFVPMIKGKKGATEKVLTQVKKSDAKVLLGFNEPEREKQGDTTVEEALDLWPAPRQPRPVV